MLTELGVTSAMKDPQLALFQGSARIVQNDDWSGSDMLKSVFKEVGTFGFPFDASKDAAMLVTLQPGPYTVQLTGTNEAMGVGLIEIYDVP